MIYNLIVVGVRRVRIEFVVKLCNGLLTDGFSVHPLTTSIPSCQLWPLFLNILCGHMTSESSSFQEQRAR